MTGTGTFTPVNAQFEMPKNCEECGRPYFRPKRLQRKMWAQRRFCSLDCAHKFHKGTKQATGYSKP